MDFRDGNLNVIIEINNDTDSPISHILFNNPISNYSITVAIKILKFEPIIHKNLNFSSTNSQ